MVRQPDRELDPRVRHRRTEQPIRVLRFVRRNERVHRRHVEECERVRRATFIQMELRDEVGRDVLVIRMDLDVPTYKSVNQKNTYYMFIILPLVWTYIDSTSSHRVVQTFSSVSHTWHRRRGRSSYRDIHYPWVYNVPKAITKITIRANKRRGRHKALCRKWSDSCPGP